jgi:hypothetical protein
MRYLVLTPNIGLWYCKGLRFELIGYSDADYAICKVDKKVLSRLANFLVGPLSLGPQRNKIPLPYPRSKRSTLLPVVVVHDYYGCDKLSRTMVTL